MKYWDIFRKLYEKAVQLDLASYDNTEFYNDFIWAIRESDTRAVKVLTDVCSFCSCVITLVGMGAVFAAIDWMAALVVLASSVLGFLSGQRQIRSVMRRRKK